VAEKYRRVPSFARSAASELLGLPSLRGTRMKGSVRLAKKMARQRGAQPVEAFIRTAHILMGSRRQSCML